MLLAFLLVWSAIKVNGEAVDQEGLRKSRQLDLGLQNINTGDEEIPTTAGLPSFQENVNNDYLPPVPSSLSPDISSAQSQQSFDLKSVNSLEKENDLCKPPFDNESCRFKDSTLDSKIPKPSRDLVPPFNDLEREHAKKPKKFFGRTNEVKTTVDIHTTPTTTTKPVTRIYKPTNFKNIARIIKTTRRPQPQVASTAEATNELRSYLPPQPEISAAAQTNVAVVQPRGQKNNNHDHHHHHHHQDENFNICDDPFHAFLCAPLKARKRITGALPASLLGQSSFINYQKALRNFDRETAPSNTVSKEYLPSISSPTNFIEPSYSQSTTSKRPITTTTTTSRPYSSRIPESSNVDNNFYLPPLPSASPAANFAPTNQAFSTVKVPTTSTPNTISVSSKTTPAVIQNAISQNVSPQLPVFEPLSSHENTFYLPPNPSPQPVSSFVSTAQSISPIVSTAQSISPIVSTITPISSNFELLPTVVSFVPVDSNSIFTPQKPIVQPTASFPTTVKPPTPVENLQTFSTSFSSAIPTALPTTQTTEKSFIPVSSFASQPSNPSGTYLPPVSSSEPTKVTVNPTTTNEPKELTNPTYLPPDPKEPAEAKINSDAVAPPQANNPFHHGRDLCTDPFHSFLCTSAKPRKRITGEHPSALSPEGSNTSESRLKSQPSNVDESRIGPQKPLEGAPAQNIGYNYPKPINPFPNPSNPSIVATSTIAPSTGYSYPHPDKIFPLPSQDFKTLSLTTTKKPEPVYRPSEARVVNGYQYSKPDKIFPLPAIQDNTRISTTTIATTTGYSYPRPQKPFPLPSDQKEIRQKPKPKTTAPPTPSLSLPTNTLRGYQYPKPDQTLKLPEKKGYSYPKPDKRLELPTEGRSNFKLPQTSNPDPLGSFGSADFIPVNKVEFKRAESSKLLMGLRRFGDRMRKRERESQLYKKH